MYAGFGKGIKIVADNKTASSTDLSITYHFFSKLEFNQNEMKITNWCASSIYNGVKLYRMKPNPQQYIKDPWNSINATINIGTNIQKRGRCIVYLFRTSNQAGYILN